MASTTSFTYKNCAETQPINGVTIDRFSALTSGTTYTSVGRCYEILSITKYDSGQDYTITFDGGPFTDCRECYGSIYDYVAVIDCINSQTYYFEFSGFTGGTPLIDEVYFIETKPKGQSAYNCYRMVDYGIYDPENPVYYTEIITSTLSTDCTGCLNSSFLTYEVTNCLGGGVANVGLSSSEYVGHLISYIDGIGDQRCGIVGELPVYASQTGTFISDYGVFTDNCDECNSQVAEQRIITNCITGSDEIVWNSLFFNGEETSNLSSEFGCFLLGDVVTGETITINEFLNFDPQLSCGDCIECNGVQYNYVSCDGTGPITDISYSYTGTSVLTDNEYTLTGVTNGLGLYSSFYVQVVSNTINNINIVNHGISFSSGDTITILGTDLEGGLSPEDDIIITVNSVGSEQSIKSNQYLETPVGTIFYNPITNECCEIISSQGITSYQYDIISLTTFDTCVDCINQDHYFWVGTNCRDGGQVGITTGVGFGVGDFVKVKIGSSDFECYELTDVYNYFDQGALIVYNTTNTESYSTCDECNQNTRIGVSVISCETNEVSYVNIPLNAWYAVAGYNDVFEGLMLSDYQGNCYRVINTCPINVVGNNLDVQHIFTSCQVCYDYYHPVIHANQNYETVIVGYLPGSGNTVGEIVTFNTPHPIWSGSDTRVTIIQDNSVTLGGFNGLNN